MVSANDLDRRFDGDAALGVERRPVEGRPADDRRSVVDLLKDLRDESTALVRQEVALAKTELSEKAAHVGRNAGALAAGGVLAFAGTLFLLLAATVGLYLGLVYGAGLSHANAGWLSPLIVGGIVTAVGGAMASAAVSKLKSESLVPERTVDSLKENSKWAQNKVSATTA